MKIIVNAHTIEIDKTTIVNAGEYNVQTCQFQFSEEYNGLVKVALFSTCENTYQINIVNDECFIPSEVLQEESNITLGVYGYEVNGDELVKRYSPTPVYFAIDKGSYLEGIEPTPPTPSVIEQIEQEITDLQNNKADKSEIPTKTSQLENDSDFAYQSDIPDVSQFVTKNTTELENYTLTSDLSEVALTGAYSDLSGTPTLSTVAATGDYDDLLNKPTIPTVPTNISAFNNDVGYITNTVNNLTNYYLKSETFTKQEVNDLISAITTMDLQVVQTLPTQDISTTTIYLVPKNPAETNNAYDEYIYVSNNWEFIGSTEVDLTDYVKNTDYANASTGGVVKINGYYGIDLYNGLLLGTVKTYSAYGSQPDSTVISKGTLENVITGKDLTTKAYVDGLVGDIATALDTINGENI